MFQQNFSLLIIIINMKAEDNKNTKDVIIGKIIQKRRVKIRVINTKIPFT